jgi:hypothetical protein
MFFFWILLVILAVVGASVLVGRSLNNRSTGGRRLSNQEKVNMAKAAGAFPHRKESSPD